MSTEEFLKLIAGWLVIYGVSFCFALTSGPFGLFKLMRKKLGSIFTSELAREGFNCPICMSFWIGIPVSFALNGGIVMWASAIGFTCVITSLSPTEGSEE